ncbi:MAG: N-acetyltransferase [Desulfobacteraceae bacterium]|nr:MAG: N-acetyltransferase [Desulfobacteraceae bacterium]
MHLDGLVFRNEPRPQDEEVVHAIVSSSGFFSPAEIEIALELLQERIAKGVSSGYHFLFAESDGKVIGYACFGPIPCTLTSFDLYWIAVRPSLRGSGVGRRILAKAESEIRKLGGARIYVETSSRELYLPTRTFYLKCGYQEEGLFKHFYAPGDHKVVFLKVLQ